MSRLAAALSFLVLAAGCSGANQVAVQADSAAAEASSAVTSPQVRSSAAASAPSGTSAAAYRPQSFRGSPKAFYAPPDPSPKVPHGTLLRNERSAMKVPGGTVWKVMYASTALTGRLIAVAGMPS